MSWLSGLSTALTAGTGGVASYLEGQQKGRKEQEDRAKEIAAMLRQKRIDEQNELMNTARMGQIGAQTKALTEPKPIAPLTHLPENALVPDGQGGWKRAVPSEPEGISPYQAAMLKQGDARLRLSQDAARRSSGQAGGAELPNTAIEKMIALDDAISAADSATQAMALARTEKANVSGRVGGVIPVPNWVRNQVGQGGETGRSLRSKIGNLTSMIGNLRSGGAITPQEFERLETFLPTPNDDEAVIEGKLADFSSFLQQMKKTRLSAYQKYGKGAGASAKEPTPAQRDWDEAVAIHGRDKVLSEYGPRPEGE